MSMAQFWFNFNNAWSGQKYYTEGSIQFYNLMYTSLPILLLGKYYYYPSICADARVCVCYSHALLLVLSVDMKKVHLTSSSMPFLYLFPTWQERTIWISRPRLYSVTLACTWRASTTSTSRCVHSYERLLSYRHTMWWYVMGLDRMRCDSLGWDNIGWDKVGWNEMKSD